MALNLEEIPGAIAEDGGTSAPSSTPFHARAQKPSARARTQYLFFALCAAIYLLSFMRVVWTDTDEGTFVSGAVKILHGQVFARDFFEVMGPGTFYLLAAFFKVFGVTFLATRIWLLVTSTGTLVSMYFLSRRVCAAYQILPSIILASVYFSTLWPMVNHHVDSNCFALLSVVCVVLWQEKQKAILLVGAGLLAGVTTCILQPKGMLLLLAFLVWILVQQRRSSNLPSSLALTAGAYCGVIGPTLLYFWNRGALWNLLDMNFVWPSHNYGPVNTIPYAMGISQFWNHWVIPIHGVPWLTPLALVLILPFVLVAALPVLVPLLGIAHGSDNLKPEIMLYWLCGWALWLSEFHRRDIAHLTAGSPLLIILCVHLLAKYRGKLADWSLQWGAISAAALAVVNLFIVLCAQSVPTRVGPVGMFKPDQVLAFLDTQVAAGTEIFCYPYCPMYYFLSKTTNPTRYSLLLYNYNTPSQFEDAIEMLDRHKVKYVVWDASFQEKAAANFYSSTMYHPDGGFLMEPYLESHYRLVKEVDGFRILERKADTNAR